MLRHWKYLKYVLRHKWFVFAEGLRLGVPIWLLIFHDWDKFMPSMWVAYTEYFYGNAPEHVYGEARNHGVKNKADVQLAFDVAWNGHQKRCKHHWQYWLLVPDQPRPAFRSQSHDGGMSHIYICRVGDGAEAALMYDTSLEWWNPDRKAMRELERVIRRQPIALPMPDAYRREMLADWRGAGRAIGKPDTRAWYLLNQHDIVLHPDTRAWIEAQLGVEVTE